jgi:hypothetical protein
MALQFDCGSLIIKWSSKAYSISSNDASKSIKKKKCISKYLELEVEHCER